MERRDWLKSALVGTGAAAAGPLVTTIAPAPGAAAQAAAEAQWQPMLFDEHQNETVVVLSELIIPATDTPGAKAAKVNEYIDLMLHDVDPDRGHAFLKGLGWLDGHAIGLHGSPFVALEQAQQVEILESLDGSDDPGAEAWGGVLCQAQAHDGRGLLHVADWHRRAEQARSARKFRLRPRPRLSRRGPGVACLGLGILPRDAVGSVHVGQGQGAQQEAGIDSAGDRQRRVDRQLAQGLV